LERLRPLTTSKLPIEPTSPPAQNARPAPVNSTTRTLSSLFNAVKASASSWYISPDRRVQLVGAVEEDSGDAFIVGDLDAHRIFFQKDLMPARSRTFFHFTTSSRRWTTNSAVVLPTGSVAVALQLLREFRRFDDTRACFLDAGNWPLLACVPERSGRSRPLPGNP